MKKILSIIMTSVLSFSLYAVNTEYKTDVVIVGSGGWYDCCSFCS